jgi:adenylosuccinate synthase
VQEFGATTGRVRQCNWINTREVRQAIDMNGVNRLVVNKMDVLREIDAWGTTERRIHGEAHFRTFLHGRVQSLTGIDKIYFSDNPHTINEENPLTAAA